MFWNLSLDKFAVEPAVVAEWSKVLSQIQVERMPEAPGSNPCSGLRLRLRITIGVRWYIGMPSACYAAGPSSIQTWNLERETNMINILRLRFYDFA